jgi:cytochrome c
MAFRFLFMTVAILFSVGASAADKVEKPENPEDLVEKLFFKSDCGFCHYDGYQAIGPSLIEISLKYKNDENAPEKLANKIREGGVGVWGVLPMPATPVDISDGDIQALITWILAKKDNPKAGEILYDQNACYECHFDEKRTIGPSLVEIAEKYKGDKTAQKSLVKKIREGGSGVWGGEKMPATTPNLSDDGLAVIADWILKFKLAPKEDKKAP